MCNVISYKTSQHTNTMNRYKLIGLMSIVSILGITSCEPISDCKTCEAVTYDSAGVEIRRESAIEYCGPALDEKENADPIVDGNETTVWECK